MRGVLLSGDLAKIRARRELQARSRASQSGSGAAEQKLVLSSLVPAVAHVVAGRVVVSSVDLAHPRAVEMHADRRAGAGVAHPVDAFVVR